MKIRSSTGSTKPISVVKLDLGTRGCSFSYNDMVFGKTFMQMPPRFISMIKKPTPSGDCSAGKDSRSEFNTQMARVPGGSDDRRGVQQVQGLYCEVLERDGSYHSVCSVRRYIRELRMTDIFVGLRCITSVKIVPSLFRSFIHEEVRTCRRLPARQRSEYFPNSSSAVLKKLMSGAPVCTG